jgi:hypothetical protein
MISSHRARHSLQIAALSLVLSTVTAETTATAATCPRFLPQNAHPTCTSCSETALIEPS